MPRSRSVWSGFIQFGLVSVPVKAYTAAASGGGSGAVSLNQLHAECNSRIQYKKTCPIHGEVTSDQIVSGYQFAKDQYVVIDPDEVEKLRVKSEKDIAVKAFVKPDAIDASQYSGKSYYLLPDNAVAQRPYALLVRAMKEQKRYAFAQVVMSGKRQIVLLRPLGKLLMMSFLSYAEDLKDTKEFEDEVQDVELSPDEMKMAKLLTDAMAEDRFDVAQFKDDYAEQMRKLVEAKVAGQEVVAPPEEPAPRIINLVEALKQSIAESQKKKPPKLVAPSPAAKAAAARKRKTS
jgi:DNA end-binding protein Ku